MNDKQSQNRFLAFGGETVFKLNPASYTQEKMWGRYMESLRKNLSAYTLDDAPEDFGNSTKMNSSSFMLQV